MDIIDAELLKEWPALFAVLVMLKIMTSFILDLITKFKASNQPETQSEPDERREFSKLQFELLYKQLDDVFSKIDKLEERFLTCPGRVK